MSESDQAIRAAVDAITNRSDGEKAILMRLRHGNELAKACTIIAHRLGWQPTKLDWRTLFACNLIVRAGKHNYITLTPHGLHWQQRIAIAMARAAGLHILLPHSSDRFNVIARCSCGWTAALSKNQGHVITGQFAAHGQHLDAVRKGLWPPRSVEKIVGEVMARTTSQPQLEHA